MQVLTTGIFETLNNGLNRKVLKMLNTYDTNDTPEDIQVKHFYESCLRIKKLNSTYTEKLKRLIAEFGRRRTPTGWAPSHALPINMEKQSS